MIAAAQLTMDPPPGLTTASLTMEPPPDSIIMLVMVAQHLGLTRETPQLTTLPRES
jgi:hypothetical protein